MSLEIKPREVLDMSAWWKQKEANLLEIFAWVDNNFSGKVVQDVVDFEDQRETEICGPYYSLISEIVEKVPFYIDSSSITHERAARVSEYIMAKAENEKATLAQIKRDKIERLKKEVAELEGSK